MRFGEFSERFKQVMATVAPTIAVDIGERHLANFSAPGRVWIAPMGRCSWARPIKMSAGQMFEITRGIVVRVWADETVADVDRQEAKDALVDVVLNALDRVAPGRIVPTDLDQSHDTEESYGEQDAFAFTLSRGVPRLRSIATMPLLPLEPTSPPNPMNPTGAPGTVTVTLTNTLEG